MAVFVSQCCGGEISTTCAMDALKKVKGIVDEEGSLDPRITEDRLMEEVCGNIALFGLSPSNQQGILELALSVERSLSNMGMFTPYPESQVLQPQTS